MTQTAAAPVSEEVGSHYAKFPYPKCDEIVSHLQARWAYNTVAGRWTTCPVPKDPRVLIAGCGTREAVNMALDWPEAEILGVDLSATSLEISQSLIDQFGLTNVRVERRDILSLGEADGEFDFISSYGVLHHMADPSEGLARIAGRLKPGGTMRLMLYNARNRYFLQEFQSMVSLFGSAGGSGAPDEIAEALTHRLRPEGTRLGEAIALARHEHESDRPAWADAFAHPRETSYDLDGLFGLLGAAGLKWLAWLDPSAWCLEPWLEDEGLRAAFDRLDRRSQWEIVDRVRMPKYEFYCGRAEDPDAEHPWMTDDEALLNSRVKAPGLRTHKIEQNRVTGEAKLGGFITVTPIEGSEHEVTIETSGGLSLRRHKFFHALLAALDGEQTLKETAEATAAKFGAKLEDVLPLTIATIRELIDPHGAIVLRPE